MFIPCCLVLFEGGVSCEFFVVHKPAEAGTPTRTGPVQRKSTLLHGFGETAPKLPLKTRARWALWKKWSKMPGILRVFQDAPERQMALWEWVQVNDAFFYGKRSLNL